MPDRSLERALESVWGGRAAGVDEAGRGPWAGPVVAAAVILPEDLPPALESGLDDSKKLSPARRRDLLAALRDCAAIGLGAASVAEITEMNILAASHLAMCRALSALPAPPAGALIDGNRLPENLPCPGEAVVNGDGRCLSIAAASIAAKVTRDRIMEALARRYPAFGWERNAGYGTRQHREGLSAAGVTRHHRPSFAPIAKMLSPVDSGRPDIA